MSALRDTVSRRRQDLDPLTTSIAPQSYASFSQTQTPASAAGLSSQFAHGQSSFTPVSSSREYNPQQWTAATGNSMRYATSSATVEAIPPPYSPPRSGRQSTSSPQDIFTMSPAARLSPAGPSYSHSPQAAAITTFPPPPSSHSRGNSRDRPHNILNLAFGRKSNAGISSLTSPELHREQGNNSARRPGPTPLTILPITLAQSSSPPNLETRPPASRRAASTSALEVQSHSRTRGDSMSRWEPGMPLPPPPPGPPPPQSNSRSQSMSRTPDSTTPSISFLAPRRSQAVPTLGPVPPTPADWVDEDISRRQSSPVPNKGLQIDTKNVYITHPPDQNSNSGSGSTSAGLSRARAVRGEPKSIRERRSESRCARTPAMEEPSNNPWAESITPSDITVPPMTILGRRPTITKSTPKSARSHQESDTPKTSKSFGTPHTAALIDSRGSTPRPLDSTRRTEAPTPPFSPDSYGRSPFYASPSLPSKSLPTPPPQSKLSNGFSRASSYQHNVSTIESVAPATGSIASENPQQLAAAQKASADSFRHATVQRHAEFAQREISASTDEERVKLFANFIVSESRLRRQRYAAAIDGMGSEILELTRDLFRPYQTHQRGASSSFSSVDSLRPGMTSGRLTPSSARPDSRQGSTTTPTTDLTSPQQSRPDSAWFGTYMPSLSPIESVSQSNNADDSSSRGRPSSRWWEVDPNGSTGSQGGTLERSKRESKYMGVPRELLGSLQWDAQGTSTTSGTPKADTVPALSTDSQHKSPEYPPEKMGWHENLYTSSPREPTPSKQGFSPGNSEPITPSPSRLDVSRLVTLPPPYPRHHPAVNNSHPDLAFIRTQVRGLSNMAELKKVQENHARNSEDQQELSVALASKRRNSFRANVQRKIEAGLMSFADAAKSEEEFKALEQEALKSKSKAAYELFQSEVVVPMNDLLMGRITHATNLFEDLRSKLFSDAQQASHNTTQEEGDEQPELLEKLTLLKWIFESREQLHRELHVLLDERNDKYMDMVIQPYKLAGNDVKAANARRFFKADSRKRQHEFDSEALARIVEFMNTIESNVTRGVEVQLSAFWDIAPSLHGTIDGVPKSISRDFHIRIPENEFEENPGYYLHPLQYLYSLLSHGEKSTYQFIESQISLLCLLHEVKSVMAAARGCVTDNEISAAYEVGEDSTEAQKEELQMKLEDAKARRRREEYCLTDDLKEKVRCVGELWESALGREMQDVKERVREFLVDQGGWEGIDE